MDPKIICIGGWLILGLMAIIPRRWVVRFAQSISPASAAEIVAASQAERPWMSAVRFIVLQFKTVVATIVAIFMVVASLIYLLNGGSKAEWATNAISSGIGFLFGEAVGATGSRHR